MNTPGVLPGSAVLLHGAGQDPRLFESLMTSMPMPTIAPLRPPYRSSSEPELAVEDVPTMAARLLAQLDSPSETVVVGVSGGATLALAIALTAAESEIELAGVIAHEPLIGAHAPELHATVASAAARLAADPRPEAAADFVHALVGDDTWQTVGPAARDFAIHHAEVVRAEVQAFMRFDPSTAALAAIRCRTLISTGSRSARCRHAAAARLAELAPVELATIDAGHMPHVESPLLFARQITAWFGADRTP